MSLQCPALMIAAPASGQGKTSVTAGLARHYRQAGLRVRCFKIGPDFIDPMILERASGAPVYQLDLWMTGEQECQRLLAEAARESDLILLEGVMGLFDGDPSAADLARFFNIPILPVINAGAMAQTFGAMVGGLVNYQPDLQFAGVVANGVASEPHRQMLAESLREPLPLYSLAKDPQAAFSERHLGLFCADDIDDLDQKIDRLAELLGEVTLPEATTFAEPEPIGEREPLLDGVTIAIARDAAFCFLYQANLDLLQQLGATLRFFSPIADSALPEADALYLPGGYPELNLAELSANRDMLEQIRTFCESGRPVIAECGGMLYLQQGMRDREGAYFPLAGVLPGEGEMCDRLQGLGLQSAELPEGELRAHTFHYSSLTTSLEASQTGQSTRGRKGEAVYRQGRVISSYLHWYFPSNPEATATLFRGDAQP